VTLRRTEIAMDREQPQAPSGPRDERIPLGTHVCLIYDNEDSRRQSVRKYVEAGLQQGEKVAYFTDTTPSEVRGWLSEAGIDVSGYEKAKRFSVSPAETMYCPDGRFVPQDMLDRYPAFYRSGFEDGCTGSRVTGETTWTLKGIPGSDRFIEYEALLNDALVAYPVTALCQYDARRFSGTAIFDVLSVHPLMIVGDQLVRNPYFVDPQEFLKSRR
jgi:hypothetical protein